jgi:hypothetical protein
MTTVGVAAGSGLAAWNILPSCLLFAQQSAAGVPDEILNPVEVSGAEAEPILGKLPGQKRMYMLPNDAGEYHRVGSQVMKRIARREDTADVHELATFAGNARGVHLIAPASGLQSNKSRGGGRTCRAWNVRGHRQLEPVECRPLRP